MFENQSFFRLALTVAAIGAALLGATTAQAQEDIAETTVSGSAFYFGVGWASHSSSESFDLGHTVDSEPEIEGENVTLFAQDGPKLGSRGISFGQRLTLVEGVEDSVDEAGTFTYGGGVDLDIDVTYSYEETVRLGYHGVFYYSFAKRFHPWFGAGVYYAHGSEASIKGEGALDVGGGVCRFSDDSQTGTSAGFVYGVGMLVNLSENMALSVAYDIYDSLDFDFDVVCDGDTYNLASFDSQVESYSAGLVWSF